MKRTPETWKRKGEQGNKEGLFLRVLEDSEEEQLRFTIG